MEYDKSEGVLDPDLTFKGTGSFRLGLMEASAFTEEAVML